MRKGKDLRFQCWTCVCRYFSPENKERLRGVALNVPLRPFPSSFLYTSHTLFLYRFLLCGDVLMKISKGERLFPHLWLWPNQARVVEGEIACHGLFAPNSNRAWFTVCVVWENMRCLNFARKVRRHAFSPSAPLNQATHRHKISCFLGHIMENEWEDSCIECTSDKQLWSYQCGRKRKAFMSS